MHFYDVHCAYIPIEPFDTLFTDGYKPSFDPTNKCAKNFFNKTELSRSDIKHVSDLYDGELRYVDSQLQRFFEGLRTKELLGRTLFVILSDHGEALHDRGYFGHNFSVHEWETRIPFWIVAPGAGKSRPSSVDTPVSTVDILPTILDYLALEAPAGLDGRSLVPLLNSPPEGSRLLREGSGRAVFARTAPEWNQPDQVALRTTRWKLHLSPQNGDVRLYDLSTSHSEQTDLASHHPEVTADLVERAERWIASQKVLRDADTPQVVDKETGEKLRALGYINQ